MRYKHIVFDIDNTLLDTEYAVLHSLQRVLKEKAGEDKDLAELNFALGITGSDALKRLGIRDIEGAIGIWSGYLQAYADTIHVFDGVEDLMKRLGAAGCSLGIVTSKTRKDYEENFLPFGLGAYFTHVVCADDTRLHKPDGAPLERYMQVTEAHKEELLYIGDSIYDRQCAGRAGVDFGLAVWGCRSFRHMEAEYYFGQPYDVWNQLVQIEDPYAGKEWIKWAMELQFIAQAGLTYSPDVYDQERFQRIRELSAELLQAYTDSSMEKINSVFCNEEGFQTPKMDTRAAIFQDGKILLVKEATGLWSMPGGWVDVNQSIKTNTVKEVKEEAGLDVIPVKLIALHDRNRHNIPVYAYGICKAFVLCEAAEGSFCSNTETVASGYFALDDLPALALDKNNEEQVRMCFEAYGSPNWEPVFD